MLKFTGKVDEVVDGMRDIPVKDAMGVPTGRTMPHRFTTIQLIVADPDRKGKTKTMAVNFFDLPPSEKLPVEGADYTTPEVRGYTNRDGQIVVRC